MGKKSESRSGMNNSDHISESLKQFFGIKYVNSLMWIRDGNNPDPGSGIEEIRIRIRDKHPGSATLLLTYSN
jgi:hypothetical protein